MTLASNNFNKTSPLPANIIINSPDCALHRASGYLAYKTQAIVGAGAPWNLNLFQVTGTIELCSIWGVFTDITNVAALTAASWNLWDGAAAVPITSAAGTVLTGASLGSTISKEAVAANPLQFDNASAGRYSEAAFNRVFVGGLMTQKVAANTYIRFTVTAGAATNCAIQFWACWVCRQPGSLFVAV